MSRLKGRAALVAAALALCAVPLTARAAVVSNVAVSCEASSAGQGSITGITRTVGDTVVWDYTTVGGMQAGSLQVGVVGSVDPPRIDFVEGHEDYGIGRVYGFRIGRVYAEEAGFETRAGGIRLPCGNTVAPYALNEKIVFLGSGMPVAMLTLQGGTRTWAGSSGAWKPGGAETAGWTVTNVGDEDYNGMNQIVMMAMARYERMSNSSTQIKIWESIKTPYYLCTRVSTAYDNVTYVDPFFSLQTVGTGKWAVKPAWVWPDLATVDDPYVPSDLYTSGYVRQSLACQTTESSATLAAWTNQMTDPYIWAASVKDPGMDADEPTGTVDSTFLGNEFDAISAQGIAALDGLLWPLKMLRDLQ
jgi:hypothetical protein